MLLGDTTDDIAYMPLRPHTTAAREKLKLAASAAQPTFTMNGSPCITKNILHFISGEGHTTYLDAFPPKVSTSTFLVIRVAMLLLDKQ